MIIEELPGSVYNLIRCHFSIKFQFRLRRQRTDFLKNRAVGDLRPVQERFNGVPENGFIDSSIFIFVKHGKKLFKFSVLIVASCGSINNVPVDIHIAVAVISLEIRSKGIVLCAVPDDIVCPPLLKIRNSLTHNWFCLIIRFRFYAQRSSEEKRSFFINLPSIRVETRSSTSVLSNSSKLLLMMAMFSASCMDRPL